MSTRQKRNSRLSGLAVPFVCILLSGYFVYHAVHGRYGTDALVRLREETRRLEFELAAVRADRKALEARVLLLHDGTMEADMLDEQVRRNLNLLGPDEVAIFLAPNQN